VQGQRLKLLDVVALDLDEPALTTRYQRENRVVRSWDWQRVRIADVNDVLQYCCEDDQALHGHAKVVEPDQMEQMPPEQWVSLQLFSTSDATFQPDPNKSHRWQAFFSVGRFPTHYRIGVTDPVATQRLNRGENVGTDCLLTLSLTEPVELPQYGMPELCYKLVAGVIELDP